MIKLEKLDDIDFASKLFSMVFKTFLKRHTYIQVHKALFQGTLNNS